MDEWEAGGGRGGRGVTGTVGYPNPRKSERGASVDHHMTAGPSQIMGNSTRRQARADVQQQQRQSLEYGELGGIRECLTGGTKDQA